MTKRSGICEKCGAPAAGPSARYCSRCKSAIHAATAHQRNGKGVNEETDDRTREEAVFTATYAQLKEYVDAKKQLEEARRQ